MEGGELGVDGHRICPEVIDFGLVRNIFGVCDRQGARKGAALVRRDRGGEVCVIWEG